MVFMWIVASLALALLVAWVTLKPFFLEAPVTGEGMDAGVGSGAKDATERALRSLKDLEFDFKLGKLSRADYEDAKKRLTAEAALLLDDKK